MPLFHHFTALEKQIKALPLESLPRFYLILSKEEEERTRSSLSLFKCLLPDEAERKKSLTSFDPLKGLEEDLFAALTSFSFFVKRHLIWIQQAERLSKNLQEKLLEEIPKLSPGFFLILSANSFAKNHPLWKLAESHGALLDHPEVKAWEKEKKMAEWVAQESANEQLLIPFDVCQALVKLVGSDPRLLRQELDKLLCFAAVRREITLKDLYALCTKTSHETIWQLLEAIFRRQGAIACSVARGLLIEGEVFLILLRQLRTQFQTHYEVALMLDQGKGGEEVTALFPFMKGHFLERHIKQARGYGLDSFRKGLLAIDAMEIRAKNGDFDDQLLVDLLMIQLTERV